MCLKWDYTKKFFAMFHWTQLDRSAKYFLLISTPKKKFIQAWSNTRMSIWWQKFHFWFAISLMCSTEFSKETQKGRRYWEKTREKVADVLALVQRLNSPLVFQPDCDKLWSVANSLSPCGAPTLSFLWPAHLSGTLVSGSETAIYDSSQLIFYWPNYNKSEDKIQAGAFWGRKH